MLTNGEKSIVFTSLMGEYNEWFWGNKQRQAEIEAICKTLDIDREFPWDEVY